MKSTKQIHYEQPRMALESSSENKQSSPLINIYKHPEHRCPSPPVCPFQVVPLSLHRLLFILVAFLNVAANVLDSILEAMICTTNHSAGSRSEASGRGDAHHVNACRDSHGDGCCCEASSDCAVYHDFEHWSL
jgi:hypothetical protein